MRKVLLETLKFLYCIVVAAISMVILSLVLDLMAAAVSGGWRDFSGQVRAGTWPILTGTVSRIWLTPMVYVLFLLLGISGIVRVMMGNHTPRFLRAFDLPAVNGVES